MCSPRRVPPARPRGRALSRGSPEHTRAQTHGVPTYLLPYLLLRRYKALNTFIDDLFAFIIKMPTLHRMSCFRDDLVFVVFLYQRWVYRVDNSRVNEFGHTGEPADGAQQGDGRKAAAEKTKRAKKTD